MALRAGALFMLALALAAPLGCDSDGRGDKGDSGGEGEGGGGADCVPVRDWFTDTAWAEVLGDTCVKCHGPGGLASQQNAQLMLLPPSYPGFIDANLQNTAQMAKYRYDGEPVLLLKPTGKLPHGGGAVIVEGDRAYEILTELVARLEGDKAPCRSDGEAATFEEIVQLNPTRTLRKAALQLVGRLPSDKETAAVADGGEEALSTALDAMLREEAFYDRLKEIWNDSLLTDRYLNWNGFALNQLYEEQYPGRVEPYALEGAERAIFNEAVAREPLELIAWIVRNDLPFSEVLTADYTVVNPFSARVYQVEDRVDFDDMTDPTEWREAQLHVRIDGDEVPIPHAGVLTSPMYLNRFPTTPTNRNRHRARMVFSQWLATDILRIAERPIDPASAGAYNNPTREDPNCTVCHQLLDPIAGAFQQYNDFDPERFMPGRQWYAEMYAPGFGREIMPRDEYRRPLQWLAQRLIKDPRFVMAVVRTMFEGLTGRAVLDWPEDPDLDGFSGRLAAWKTQDAELRRVGAVFEGSGLDLRVVVREIVMGPWFRAEDLTGEVAPAREAAIASVGTGRLISPERLSDKLEAAVGVRWARAWDGADYLLTDYKILYGGIDSDVVTRRLTEPNGVMAAVMDRMAHEVSCNVVAWDFTKDRDDRLLFPFVDYIQVPVKDDGTPIEQVEANIRKNIQHLHRLLLDEALEPGEPELERTYELFETVRRVGAAAVAEGDEPRDLVWPCRGRWDRLTGAELPSEDVVENDQRYAMRAWSAVMTYLLTDYRFLYE